MDEIKAAKEAGTSSGLKPCFLGCVLKKGNIVSILSIILVCIKVIIVSLELFILNLNT